MEETNELIEQRYKKLGELRSSGIDPYDGRFEPESPAQELHNRFHAASPDDLEVNPVVTSVAGRIVALRDFGKAAFAHIQDATGKIQVYFKRDVLGERFQLLKSLD